MRRIGFLGVLCALIALPGGASAPLAGDQPAFTAPGLTAPAPPPEIADVPVVLLVDLGSGQTLFARQPDLHFVPASMTKVMTLFVAFNWLEQGKIRPEDVLTVKEQTAREWAGKGTSLYLKAGDRISIDQLLRAIATVSANDAAAVLSDSFDGGWSAHMGQAAEELGMHDSHFATPSGWPDNGATYVSARDLVTLADAMIERHPAHYRRYFGQKQMQWHDATYYSHDPTVGVVPGADGIKTGHTDEAGYNFLGSAIRGGRRLVMVIAGAKSEDQRMQASRALLEWGFAAWDSRPLFAKGARVGEALVQGGDARQVGLIAARPISQSFAKAGAPGQISLKIVYRGPLQAPLEKGAAVAELEINAAGLPPSRVPLVTAEAVGKAGPLDRLWNGLMGLIS